MPASPPTSLTLPIPAARKRGSASWKGATLMRIGVIPAVLPVPPPCGGTEAVVDRQPPIRPSRASLADDVPITAVIHHGLGSRSAQQPEIVDDPGTGYLCHDEQVLLYTTDHMSEIDRAVCRTAAEERLSRQRMSHRRRTARHRVLTGSHRPGVVAASSITISPVFSVLPDCSGWREYWSELLSPAVMCCSASTAEPTTAGPHHLTSGDPSRLSESHAVASPGSG